MSLSHTTLHGAIASASDPSVRVWSYETHQVTAGLWLATAELARAAGQVGAAMKLIGRGPTRAAAIVALAAEVDAFELMLSDGGGAA